MILTALGFARSHFSSSIAYPPRRGKGELDRLSEEMEDPGDMWGWNEGMGWREDSEASADLGEIAEERYRLGFDASASGREECVALSQN